MEKSTTERIVVDSLLRLDKRIVIPIRSNPYKTGQDVMRILQSHPEIFYVIDFKLVPSKTSTLIIPHYAYDANTIKHYIYMCQDKIDRMLQKVSKVTDCYHKALLLHDVLSEKVCYSKIDDFESHTIIAPLLKDRAVCEGFSKVYCYLLSQAGIKAIIVNGYACNPQLQKFEKHSWNMINIDNYWCHVDVTFDTTINENHIQRYDYFCIPNEWIVLDHKYNVSEYPLSVTKEYSFYERNNMVMITREKLRKNLMKGLLSGEKDFVFKLPYSAPETNLEKKVAKELETVLSEIGLFVQYAINYNLKQRVFQISLIGDNTNE